MEHGRMPWGHMVAQWERVPKVSIEAQAIEAVQGCIEARKGTSKHEGMH